MPNWTATCDGVPGEEPGCPLRTTERVTAVSEGAALAALARGGWLRLWPGGKKTDLCPPCADHLTAQILPPGMTRKGPM